MNKLLLGVFIALIAGIGIFVVLLNSGSSITTKTVANEPDIKDVKTFAFTGINFKFLMNGVENPDIKVRQGDKVRVEFTSTEGFHDWKIDEFNAATQKVNAGSSTFVEFIADKKGTFEYYCSVGSHRAMGMTGKFIVE